MSKYLLALDAGTGSIRAVLFSVDGEQVGVAQREWEHHEDPRWPGSMDFDWVADWQLLWTASKRFWQRPPLILKKSLVFPPPACARASSCMTRTAMRFGRVLTLTLEALTRSSSSLIWIQSLKRRFTRRVVRPMR